MRGDAHQSRPIRQARHRRHLCRYLGRGMGAAGRPRDPVRLPAVQRAAAAALGHRQALRPANRRGPDRPQLLAPDGFERDRLLRQGQVQLQSVHRRPARSACASTSSTATISTTARTASSAAAISGQVQTNGRPIETTRAAARHAGLGREMETGREATTISARSTPAAACHGSCYSYRDNYLDLDPTYKDRFGRPLLRMTMDFHENELKMSAFLTDRYAEIIEGDGRQAGGQAAAQRALRRHQISDLASVRRRHHGRPIPADSALNSYLQSWDVPNLFVQGATRVSAKRRLQPDRHGRGARLSGRRRRSARNISKIPGRWSMRKPRPLAVDCRVCCRARHCGWLASGAGRRHRSRRISTRSSVAAISRSSAIARACHTLPRQRARLRRRTRRSRRRSAICRRPTSRRISRPASAPGPTTSSSTR